MTFPGETQGTLVIRDDPDAVPPAQDTAARLAGDTARLIGMEVELMTGYMAFVASSPFRPTGTPGAAWLNSRRPS